MKDIYVRFSHDSFPFKCHINSPLVFHTNTTFPERTEALQLECIRHLTSLLSGKQWCSSTCKATTESLDGKSILESKTYYFVFLPSSSVIPPPVFLNYLPLMGVFIHQLVRKLFWVPGVVLMLELQRWPDNSVRERQVWELLQCPLVSASERERLLTQSERLSRARQRSQRACVEIKCQHRLGVRQQLRNGNRCREQLPWAALDA